MQQNAKAFSARLRQSAVKNNQFVLPKFKHLMAPALLDFLNPELPNPEIRAGAFSLQSINLSSNSAFTSAVFV